MSADAPGRLELLVVVRGLLAEHFLDRPGLDWDRRAEAALLELNLALASPDMTAAAPSLETQARIDRALAEVERLGRLNADNRALLAERDRLTQELTGLATALRQSQKFTALQTEIRQKAEQLLEEARTIDRETEPYSYGGEKDGEMLDEEIERRVSRASILRAHAADLTALLAPSPGDLKEPEPR